MSAPEESPSALFQRALKIPAALADRLDAEGFTSIEEVAYVPLAEILEASGLDSEAVHELRRIARLYLLNVELGRED